MVKKDNNTGTDNTGEFNTGNWNSGNRNSGNRNSGNSNSGYGNSGNSNSGYWNSGNWNSGNSNSGYGNSGNSNSGYGNSGNSNSGNSNSGYWNSGNRNSGNSNSGNWNSGNSNSGYWNSGNRNSGNSNSGYGNSGNSNSGCFNTDEPYARFFNKPTTIKMSDFRYSDAWPDFSEMNPCVWIESSMMTEEEKKEHSTYETTGGYLKTLEYKDAWAVWKRKCTKENWEKVLALPNFDPAIFEQITGIKVNENSEAKQKAAELREQADRMLEKAKELESSL